MYLSSYAMQEAYDRNYKTLLKQSLLGKGDALSQILEQRMVLVKAFRASSIHMRWLEELASSLLEPIEAILDIEESPAFFQRGCRQFPILAENTPLETRLPMTASDLLIRFGFESSDCAVVESIVRRSSFQSGFRRYRCGFDSQNLPYIEGEDTPYLRSLVGIAHELGHLLFELQSNDQSIAIQYMSEASAHLAEETVVLRCLRTVGLEGIGERYVNYLRQVDLLNFVLFREECFELLNGGQAPLTLFDQPSYVFRESLITAIGYQAYNANASLLRWNNRNTIELKML